MPTIHTHMWQQRRRWLWLYVVLRLLQIAWLFQIVVIYSIVLLAINFWHATHFCVDKGS